MEVKPTTRHQRRARRQEELSAAREAHVVARMAGLDYRVSGESGALRVHTHCLTWHRSKSLNITLPPPERGWDRSGPARQVGKPEGRIAQPVNHHQRGKQVAEKATVETTE